MANFHINPETGRAGKCSASSPESCKFSSDAGTVVAHYDSKEEAKAAYEKMNESQTTTSVKRSKPNNKNKVDVDQERKKLATVNRRVERLNSNLQNRKFKLLDLNKSLSLDKTKEERDEIYENIKKENEEILHLDKKRKESLKEQKEIAQKIEKEQRKTEPKSNYRPSYYDGGPCGGARAC